MCISHTSNITRTRRGAKWWTAYGYIIFDGYSSAIISCNNIWKPPGLMMNGLIIFCIKTSGPGINLFYLQTRSFHVLPIQSHAHSHYIALLFSLSFCGWWNIVFAVQNNHFVFRKHLDWSMFSYTQDLIRFHWTKNMTGNCWLALHKKHQTFPSYISKPFNKIKICKYKIMPVGYKKKSSFTKVYRNNTRTTLNVCRYTYFPQLIHCNTIKNPL